MANLMRYAVGIFLAAVLTLTSGLAFAETAGRVPKPPMLDAAQVLVWSNGFTISNEHMADEGLLAENVRPNPFGDDCPVTLFVQSTPNLPAGARDVGTAYAIGGFSLAIRMPPLENGDYTTLQWTATLAHECGHINLLNFGRDSITRELEADQWQCQYLLWRGGMDILLADIAGYRETALTEQPYVPLTQRKHIDMVALYRELLTPVYPTSQLRADSLEACIAGNGY